MDSPQAKSSQPESPKAPELPTDPTYGYTLKTLLEVQAPEAPAGFSDRWRGWFKKATQLDPRPVIHDTGQVRSHWKIFEINYRSTDEVLITGWLLVPKSGGAKRGFVVGHGYGGCAGPDINLPFPDAAILFPCARGISKSKHPNIPSQANDHVLHRIRTAERYVLRGCSEDTWLGVSSLLQLFPQVEGHIGYLGISFSGGVGALALPWDHRIQRAHVNVPSFGNQALRLTLPSIGSAESVREFEKKHPGVALNTLQWFDAASAARHIEIPMHFACALADPAVAPPGQFSIHNAKPGEKELFVLEAGHMDYPSQAQEETELLQELETFFAHM